MTARRVLHCIPSMGGGGAERQLTYLASALSAFDWEVHVAIGSEGPNLERLRASGARIHQLAGFAHHDPLLVWRLLQLVRRIRPQLVQVWLLQMEIAGAIAATLTDVPWILSERSSELAYPRTWKNRLRIAAAARAAAIASNSPAGDAYWAAQRGVPDLRVVIPNALPLREIDAVVPADAATLGFPHAARIVLFAGRLIAEKNVDTLVQAVRTVLAATPDAVAVFAGDGPLAARLRSAAAADSVGSRMAWPGYLASPWTWMKRADVFVSVSRFEGHPNTVLEAAACGAPLMLSDIPAHRAVFDERCAMFAPVDDPGAIACAIAGVLADPEAARARASAARERVGHLDAMTIAARYDQLYRQVLERGGAAAEEPTRESTGRTAPW